MLGGENAGGGGGGGAVGESTAFGGGGGGSAGTNGNQPQANIPQEIALSLLEAMEEMAEAVVLTNLVARLQMAVTLLAAEVALQMVLVL